MLSSPVVWAPWSFIRIVLPTSSGKMRFLGAQWGIWQALLLSMKHLTMSPSVHVFLLGGTVGSCRVITSGYCCSLPLNQDKEEEEARMQSSSTKNAGNLHISFYGMIAFSIGHNTKLLILKFIDFHGWHLFFIIHTQFNQASFEQTLSMIQPKLNPLKPHLFHWKTDIHFKLSQWNEWDLNVPS